MGVVSCLVLSQADWPWGTVSSSVASLVQVATGGADATVGDNGGGGGGDGVAASNSGAESSLAEYSEMANAVAQALKELAMGEGVLPPPADPGQPNASSGGAAPTGSTAGSSSFASSSDDNVDDALSCLSIHNETGVWTWRARDGSAKEDEEGEDNSAAVDE
jgi:hypothetical protein